MKGTIVNFRGTQKRKSPNHMIIIADTLSSREEAEKQVGKNVVWKSPAKKELKGKIASAHGNKGAVRAIFETGMPGQSIGTEVEIN